MRRRARSFAPRLRAPAWEAGRMLTPDGVVAEAMQFDVDPSVGAHIDGTSPLSAREREVALLLVQGMSNREIAERLTVSERTAEKHVQHVLNRLGLRSGAQVAAWAIQHGWLTEQPSS